jgi:hypothetical protein
MQIEMDGAGEQTILSTREPEPDLFEKWISEK